MPNIEERKMFQAMEAFQNATILMDEAASKVESMLVEVEAAVETGDEAAACCALSSINRAYEEYVQTSRSLEGVMEAAVSTAAVAEREIDNNPQKKAIFGMVLETFQEEKNKMRDVLTRMTKVNGRMMSARKKSLNEEGGNFVGKPRTGSGCLLVMCILIPFSVALIHFMR